MDTSQSATSMNFVGLNDVQRNGTAPLLFNRVVILPPQRMTAGKWIHPAAGFIPGQQPYLKPKMQVYNRSMYPVNRKLARQNYRQVIGSFY